MQFVNRLLVLLVLVFFSSWDTRPAWAEEQVSIAGYLAQLAAENQFEVIGASIVGAESFMPPRKPKSLEKTLGRALARFNHRIDYRDQQVLRVIILSRKGTSVGALPDEQPEVRVEPVEADPS